MVRRLLLALLVVVGAAAPGDAAVPASSYVLTAWTEENGLPSGEILAMTQDLDGYLWLGTNRGLVRFDGARFVEWGSAGATRLPSGSVPALVAAADGSLWIGHANGGVSRLRDSEVVTYGATDGIPEGPISILLQDRQGTVWVGASGGLARFRDGDWQSLHADAEVFTVYEDRSDRLWVGTSTGVFRVVGDALELQYPQALSVQHFVEDAAGEIWVTDLRHIVRPLGSDLLPAHADDVRLPQSGWRVVRDQRSRIWIAALGGGLLRLDDALPRVIQRVTYEHVLAGAPRSLFHDREGNIWVGMRPNGLLRVSERFVRGDVPLEGLTNDGVRAMAAAEDGSVWIGTGHNLLRFDGSSREVYDVAQSRVLYNDARRAVWAVTTNGLHRVVNGQLIPVTVPGAVRWDRITSMAIDAAGTMWLCSSNEGVMAWRDATLTPFRDIPGAPLNCSSVYADRTGRVWFGFGNGALAVYEHGAFRSYGPQDGLAGGAVLAILEDRSGALWVATRDGVSRSGNGRFISLTGANGPFEAIAAAFVEDEQGFLWVGVDTGAGVVRFDPREAEALAVDPQRQIEYRLFDASDGMQGELRPLIRAAGVRGGDGRLWFATGLGVVIFDPRALPSTQRPRAPRIESVLIDGRRTGPSADPLLPNQLSTLAIEYTTASIGAASKVRFRHRLEGRDDDWVSAGSVRAVSYENLAPGRYRFQVSATTDGVWTEPAVWAFAVAQPLYQQSWFLLIVGLGLVAVGGAAWSIRVGALRKRYALVFEERARVSREVHDTLLQSMAAVGVELETIATQLHPADGQSRDALRRLRKQVGHSLRDARDSIWGLRHNRMESRGLVDALRELSETGTEQVRVELSVVGRPVPSPADVEVQLLRIAQEAVRNGTRHGRATHIHVVLDYGSERLLLSVSDNGCGFTVDEYDNPAASGDHLGLLGMRERAERIKAEIAITSSPGKGSTVEVSVPLTPARPS